MLHPILIYRKKLKLTQRALADLIQSSDAVLFDLENSNSGTVTDQWVRRLEMGMVNPSSDFMPVARVLSDELYRRLLFNGAREAVANVDGILFGYAEQINLEDHLLIDTPESYTPGRINSQILDWYTIIRGAARGVVETVDRMWGWSPVDIQRQITLTLSGGKSDSEYAFCRLLGVHPFSVQTWTKENSKDPEDWPAAIRHVLTEIGLRGLLE